MFWRGSVDLCELAKVPLRCDHVVTLVINFRRPNLAEDFLSGGFLGQAAPKKEICTLSCVFKGLPERTNFEM